MIKLVDLKDGYYVQSAFVVMEFLSYPCCQTSGEFLTWVKGVGEGEAVEDKHLGSKLAGGGWLSKKAADAEIAALRSTRTTIILFFRVFAFSFEERNRLRQR